MLLKKLSIIIDSRHFLLQFEIEYMDIQLNKIRREDLELLRQWRMKENVTKYMFTDPHITMEEQIAWYNRISNDISRIDFTINVYEKVIGHYYITDIDKDNKECQVGFYIGDDANRGKGIYVSVQMAINRFVFNKLNLNKIEVYSFADNPNCKKYPALGFMEDKSKEKKYIKNNIEHIVKCYVIKKEQFIDNVDANNNVIINYL